MRQLGYIFFLIFTLTWCDGFAQQDSDQQLASYYFQSGDFEKAALYYEQLYEKNQNDYYYSYLLKCYVQLEDYNKAEKLVKEQLKKYKDNSKYYVDQGYIYQKLGDDDKAKKYFEKAIKELQPNQNKIIQLANSFIGIGENEYAIQTFQEGKSLLAGRYPFNIEKAELYASMNKWPEMIEELLSLLEVHESYLQTVQNSLSRSINFEKKTMQNQLLKTELLKKIQKNPNSKVFGEMLIWLYVQLQDFNAAYIQIKAMDKRFKEDGGRIVALAKTCTNNSNYDLAIEAYQYIISYKGKDNYYYQSSKMELLNVMKQKITVTEDYTNKDLRTLESLYLKTLNELGKTNNTVSILKELADLEAYYIHNIDTAITILEDAINLPALKPKMLAECKLSLGDLLLIKGDVWDALLLYAQVDKDFKYDELGERAKLKSAKTHYYNGDFNFAKGQLDVLKGSTSKLISNDAMELSRLITDNSTVDTTTIPLKIFARADLLFFQNKYNEAYTTLDSISLLYPGHALADEVLFQKYKIAMKEREYSKASEFLNKIIETYAYDILADNALFYLADLHQFKFDNQEKAMELYQKLLTDYPGSLFVVEARNRFRQLRGDEIN